MLKKRWPARLATSPLVGTRVTLRNVKLGKYAGRVVADVIIEDGRSLADILITADLARSYDGGTREGWCQDDGG